MSKVVRLFFRFNPFFLLFLSQNEIKSLQGRLKKLLASETNHPLTSTSLTSPQHILLAKDLPVWAETTPTFEPEQNTFPFNRHLNEIVAVHRGDITALECDVLIMPISSCHKEKNKNRKNFL